MGKFVIAKGGGDALIIIDPQNDFVRKDGALYVAGIPGELPNRQVIRNIKSLTWKPFDWKVVSADQHPVDQHVEYRIFRGKHCVVGTEGASFVKELAFLGGLGWCVLTKGQEPGIISYSIVTSPGFPYFIDQMRLLEIKRVFVVGWAYTHCVGESAIAIASQGFETFVVRDATRSVPPPFGNPEAMDQKLTLYGVKKIYVEDII